MSLLLILLALAAEPKDSLTTQVQVIDGLVDSGMVDAALSLCTELKAQGISSPELDIAQARAMAAAGMKADARDLLIELVARHKRNAAAWAQLGIIQADLGDAAAESSLKRALELDPDNADILNNLGYLALADTRYTEAETLLRRALKTDPSNLTTRNNLGLVLALQEKDKEALEMFRSTGSEAEARYNLGVACEWRHDTAAAIVQYQAAIEASPGYTPAVYALKKLILQEGTP
jgi:pentatricopeptide repeat protein